MERKPEKWVTIGHGEDAKHVPIIDGVLGGSDRPVPRHIAEKIAAGREKSEAHPHEMSHADYAAKVRPNVEASFVKDALSRADDAETALKSAVAAAKPGTKQHKESVARLTETQGHVAHLRQGRIPDALSFHVSELVDRKTREDRNASRDRAENAAVRAKLVAAHEKFAAGNPHERHAALDDMDELKREHAIADDAITQRDRMHHATMHDIRDRAAKGYPAYMSASGGDEEKAVDLLAKDVSAFLWPPYSHWSNGRRGDLDTKLDLPLDYWLKDAERPNNAEYAKEHARAVEDASGVVGVLHKAIADTDAQHKVAAADLGAASPSGERSILNRMKYEKDADTAQQYPRIEAVAEDVLENARGPVHKSGMRRAVNASGQALDDAEKEGVDAAREHLLTPHKLAASSDVESAFRLFTSSSRMSLRNRSPENLLLQARQYRQLGDGGVSGQSDERAFLSDVLTEYDRRTQKRTDPGLVDRVLAKETQYSRDSRVRQTKQDAENARWRKPVEELSDEDLAQHQRELGAKFFGTEHNRVRAKKVQEEMQRRETTAQRSADPYAPHIDLADAHRVASHAPWVDFNDVAAHYKAEGLSPEQALAKYDGDQGRRYMGSRLSKRGPDTDEELPRAMSRVEPKLHLEIARRDAAEASTPALQAAADKDGKVDKAGLYAAALKRHEASPDFAEYAKDPSALRWQAGLRAGATVLQHTGVKSDNYLSEMQNLQNSIGTQGWQNEKDYPAMVDRLAYGLPDQRDAERMRGDDRSTSLSYNDHGFPKDEDDAEKKIKNLEHALRPGNQHGVGAAIARLRGHADSLEHHADMIDALHGGVHPRSQFAREFAPTLRKKADQAERSAKDAIDQHKYAIDQFPHERAKDIEPASSVRLDAKRGYDGAKMRSGGMVSDGASVLRVDKKAPKSVVEASDKTVSGDYPDVDLPTYLKEHAAKATHSAEFVGRRGEVGYVRVGNDPRPLQIDPARLKFAMAATGATRLLHSGAPGDPIVLVRDLKGTMGHEPVGLVAVRHHMRKHGVDLSSVSVAEKGANASDRMLLLAEKFSRMHTPEARSLASQLRYAADAPGTSSHAYHAERLDKYEQEVS